MLRVCATPGCPKLTSGTRCDEHELRTSTSTSGRGYGIAHQRRRAQLLPAAIGELCPLCGVVMLAFQDLDLHHSTSPVLDPRSVGDEIVHAACNRAAGESQAAA